MKSSWGLLITIVADTLDADGAGMGAIPLRSNIWLLDATFERSLASDVMQILAQGIEPLAAEVSSAVGGGARVIAIHDVRYSECDFQIEGLAAGIYCWVIAEFGLEEREILVSFNKDENRYVFNLPGLDSL